MLVVSAVLFVYILATRAADARRSRRAFTFSAPVHAPASDAGRAQHASASGSRMMIALTVVNYGFPIVQLALLEGTSVPVVPVGETVMARARASVRVEQSRGSAGASSALAVLTVVSLLVGFVVAAVGACRLQRAGPLGEHLPRGRRSGEVGPSDEADAKPAGRTTSVVLEPAMARTGAQRRDRPRRDARAAAVHDVPRRAGSERGRCAEPRRAVSGSGRQADARLQERRSRAARSCRRSRRNLSDQDIADLAAYYASLPKARTAPPPIPTRRCRRSCASATRCATSRRASPATAASTSKLGTPWLEGMPKQYLRRAAQGVRVRRAAQRQPRADAQHGARDDAAGDRRGRGLLRALRRRSDAPLDGRRLRSARVSPGDFGPVLH